MTAIRTSAVTAIRTSVVTAIRTSVVTATGTMTVSGTTTVSDVTATASGAAARICGMFRYPRPGRAVTMRRLTDKTVQRQGHEGR